MSDIVQFPATAAKALVEGYCNDFIQLAASLAQTLEQVSMRKLELGESREPLVRVEKGMRDLADAIGALLESTEAPAARSAGPRRRDRLPAGARAAGDPVPPPPMPSVPELPPIGSTFRPPSPADAPPARIGDRPTRDCIIQGTTDSMPMTSVFQFLSRMHKSGELLVAIDGEQLTLELVDGCVEAARSTNPPPGERIGEMLVAKGYVRPEQLAEITRGERCTVHQLGTKLLRARQITIAQLRDALRTQAISRIQRVIQAKRANYEFHEGRREPRPDYMRIRLPLQRPAIPSRSPGQPQRG